MKRCLIALLLFSGCSSNSSHPDVVVMRNPATSEIVQCRRYPWGSVVTDDVEQCVIGYKSEGWIVSR
jgi:hypothetical protein